MDVYNFIFILNGNTFLTEDDLAHAILKPTILFECFRSKCDGVRFFLDDIAQIYTQMMKKF